MLSELNGNKLPDHGMIVAGKAAISNGKKTIHDSFSKVANGFTSLSDSFQSQTSPLGNKPDANFTTISISKDQKETSATPPSGACSKKKLFLVALLTGFAGYQSLEALKGSSSQVKNNGNLDNPFGIFSATTVKPHGRELLSTTSSANYTIEGTEELDLEDPTYNIIDLFPSAASGRLVPSTTSPLPEGVEVVYEPMQVLSSIPNGQYGPLAATNEALYVSQTGSKAIQIFNIKNPSNVKITNIFDSGTIVMDLKVIGDRLYCCGSDMVIHAFDISDPFNPTSLGQVSIPGMGITKFALNKNETKFACISSTRFICGDISDPQNPIITGNFTEFSGILRAITTSSEPDSDYFYVGTTTGLVIFNTSDTNSPNIVGNLTSLGILDLVYYNGFCYGTSSIGSKLMAIDVQDPSNPILVNNISYSETLLNLFPPKKKTMSYISTIGMGILDLTNMTNPSVMASSFFPDAKRAAFLENLVIFGRITDINIATRWDTVKFKGFPKGGSEGEYPVKLNVRSLNGGQTVNATQIFNLMIQPAIKAALPIKNLVGVVDLQFQKILSSNTFLHAAKGSMSYLLHCEPPRSSSSISLNPFSAELTGLPQKEDVGSTECVIKATDIEGASGSSAPFNYTVYYGPKFAPIRNQLARVGIPFHFNLTGYGFSQDPLSKLSYTISGLPSSLIFENGTISGTTNAKDIGFYEITATITDQNNNISRSTTFQLNIAEPGVPFFLTPISSQLLPVDSSFTIAIPSEAAVNPSNPDEPIIYTASLADGSPLPSWMIFDGTKFEGTPPSSELKWGDVEYDIKLTATQNSEGVKQASSSTIFRVTLTGTSMARKATIVLGVLPGVVGVIWGLRVCAYNKIAPKPCLLGCINKVCCCYAKIYGDFTYSGSVVDIFERQSFACQLNTPPSKIAYFETFYDHNEECADGGRPRWLKYDRTNNTLHTQFVPDLGGTESIKIIAKSKKGRDLEVIILNKQTHDDHNFTRTCKTPFKQVSTITFISERDGTQVSKPNWLECEKRWDTLKIKAENVPSLKAIDPMIICIRGGSKDGDDFLLETIYLNTPTKKIPNFSNKNEDEALLLRYKEPKVEVSEIKTGDAETVAVEMASLRKTSEVMPKRKESEEKKKENYEILED